MGSAVQPITLTTDFGSTDHYVGVMKGVILRIAPTATIVDITHEIGAHNIVHGAFALRQILAWYPAGSVHVVVVDPGVGTDRRIIAGRYSGQIVIAPDNGLISVVHRELHLEEMYSVENTRYFAGPVSPTFHGRDILAPVAAHVASGVPLSHLGPPAGQIDILRFPVTQPIDSGGLRGCVVYVDHFGNLVTNISADEVGQLMRQRGELTIHVGDQPAGPLRRVYGEVPADEPLALIGSSGMMEVAVNCGRACDRFGAGPDTLVTLDAAER